MTAKLSAKTDNANKTRYLQIADALIASIQRGEYALGTYLPTEKDLCDQYQVSRHTVREALRQLSSAGLIERKQGSGSLVVNANPPTQYNQFVQSIDDLLQYGEATRFDIKRVKALKASAVLAERLQCQPGDALIQLHGVRYLRHSQAPFCLSDIYRINCPPRYEGAYLNKDEAIYALLEELDLQNLSRVEQFISATALKPTQARVLKRVAEEPALQTIRHYYDNKAKKIVVAISYHPFDLYTFSTVLKRL